MKLKAVAVTVLVLAVQLFSVFVPSITAVAAEASDGTGQEVTVPYSQTTILADLVSPELVLTDEGKAEATASLLDQYPKIPEKGRSDAEVITAVVQKNANSYSAFFYVYIPGGTESVLAGSFTLSNGSSTLYESAALIDRTATILKYRISLTNAQYALFKVGDEYQLTLELFTITYRKGQSSDTEKTTYFPVTKEFNGCAVSSEMKLTFDSEGKSADDMIVKETLRLDVHMAQERYSTTSDSRWTQLNTAYFVIPGEYLEMYKRVHSIEYQYRLLKDIPMFITEDKEFLEKLAVFEQFDITINADIESKFLLLGALGEAIFNFFADDAHLGPYFRFYVDKISHDENDPVDVSSEDVWAEYKRAYQFAWNLYYGSDRYAEAFYFYIHGGRNPDHFFDYAAWRNKFRLEYSFELFFVKKVLRLDPDSYTDLQTKKRTYKDIISTGEPYSSTDLLTRLFDGRLLDTLIGEIHDDSIDVPAIQTVFVKDLADMSVSEIGETYCVDDKYAEEIEELAKKYAADDTFVFFHCVETDYYVLEPGGAMIFDWFNSEMLLPGDGYVVKNTAILDFNIINLYFNEGEVKVPVVHKTVNFIGDIESGDSMYDEIADTAEEKIGDWWDAYLGLVRIVYLISAIVVFVFIVWGIFWLVDKGRDAFGKRGGGG